ncbi:MAG: hypothetical protein WAZ69_11785, partial [Trichococcus flocculiformis]
CQGKGCRYFFDRKHLICLSYLDIRLQNHHSKFFMFTYILAHRPRERTCFMAVRLIKLLTFSANQKIQKGIQGEIPFWI